MTDLTQKELEEFRHKAQQPYPNFGSRQAKKLFAFLDATIARAGQAEAERDALAEYFDDTCPHMLLDAWICEPCNPDPGKAKACWLLYARHEVQKRKEASQ